MLVQMQATRYWRCRERERSGRGRRRQECRKRPVNSYSIAGGRTKAAPAATQYRTAVRGGRRKGVDVEAAGKGNGWQKKALLGVRGPLKWERIKTKSPSREKYKESGRLVDGRQRAVDSEGWWRREGGGDLVGQRWSVKSEAKVERARQVTGVVRCRGNS